MDMNVERRISQGEKPPTFSPEILLLQGPVGPFFGRLQESLEAAGMDTLRIHFSPADRLFRHSGDRARNINYDGGEFAWASTLEEILDRFPIRTIVLFGNRRPAHRVAIEMARERGVAILSLEEGYVRPGYITAEWDGNNADSPLAGRCPDNRAAGPVDAPSCHSSFLSMAGHAALHYLFRNLFSDAQEREMFHRAYPIRTELLSWATAAISWLYHSSPDAEKARRLVRDFDEQYVLATLQVPTDSNMECPAAGWTSADLIDELCAAASQVDPELQIVFKLHPLARNRMRIRSHIDRAAQENGLAQRVHVLEFGPTETLAQHARAMITINSTSGLFALRHGTPLLALGRGFYTTPGLVHAPIGKAPISRFLLKARREAPRTGLEPWIIRNALVPGSYYTRAGAARAARGVSEKLLSPPTP